MRTAHVPACSHAAASCSTQDAVTYLVAAWFAHGIPRELGAPDAAAKQLKKFASMRQVELAGVLDHQEAAPAGSHRPHSRSSVDAAETGSHHAGMLTHAEHRHHYSPERKAKAWEPASPEPAAEVAALQEHDAASDPSGRTNSGSSSLAAGSAGQRAGGGAALLAAATGALAEGVRALHEGWTYMRCRENRDVAALVLMKCAAALTWGAVDIINVKIRWARREAHWCAGSASHRPGGMGRLCPRSLPPIPPCPCPLPLPPPPPLPCPGAARWRACSGRATRPPPWASSLPPSAWGALWDPWCSTTCSHPTQHPCAGVWPPPTASSSLDL